MNSTPTIIGLAVAGVILLSRRDADAAIPAPPVDINPSIDVELLARTIWGEARGEGAEGMQAVANVIVNRVEYANARGGYWWGNTIRDVVLKRSQFSVWNPGDPNLDASLDVDAGDLEFLAALNIADRAIRGTLPDITGGATHYHADHVRPAWVNDGTKVASIGAHDFYKGIA